MTLATVCKHYGLTLAEARGLRLWELNTLVGAINDEHKRAERAQSKNATAFPRRR